MVIGQNFTGSTYGINSAAIPPDANGAVGTRYFVEFINGTFAVYNKTNGVNVKRIADTKFWSNAGVVLATSDGITDPRVIYDPISQRWFASMVDFDANAAGGGGDPTLESNDFLLAVSLTSDPTGAWIMICAARCCSLLPVSTGRARAELCLQAILGTTATRIQTLFVSPSRTPQAPEPL